MRKRIILFYLSTLFGMLSCVHEPAQKEPEGTQDDRFTYKQSNKNALLAGMWIIEGLDIPDCKLCAETGTRLNKMWHNELRVGDTFHFAQDSMLYKSIRGQTQKERFRFTDSLLSLEGFDWSYMMEVRKYTLETLHLAITQSYPSEINSTERPKDLIVKMVRVK